MILKTMEILSPEQTQKIEKILSVDRDLDNTYDEGMYFIFLL